MARILLVVAWLRLAGFTTVKEAMADESFAAFITALMNDEIVPSITSETYLT